MKKKICFLTWQEWCAVNNRGEKASLFRYPWLHLGQKKITSAAVSYLLSSWSLLFSYVLVMKSIITDFIDVKVDLFVCLLNKKSIMSAFTLLSTWERKCSFNLIVFCWFTYPLISVWKQKVPNQVTMKNC